MKKFCLFTLLLAMVLSVTGCGLVQSVQTRFSGESVRIGIMPDVQSVPFVVADAQKYFSKAGVKVTLIQYESAQERDEALRDGLIDGMVTDFIAVLLANENGFPVQAVAKTDGDMYLLAGKSSGIRSLNEAEGKSIGLSGATIMEFTVDVMLQRADISPEDVEKALVAPITHRFEMLQEGAFDLAILPEPLSQLASEQGAVSVRSTRNSNIKAGVIAFRTDFLISDPGKVKAVFTAYDQAVEYLNEADPSAYTDLLIKRMGFPPELRESLVLPQYTPAESPHRVVFVLAQNWVREKGLIEKDYSFNYIVDHNILQ